MARSVMDVLDRVDEIFHIGVKGMKWGVRRSREERERARSADANTLRDVKSKAKKTKIASLSNQELQAAITRMNLEKQYVSLNQSSYSKGKKFMKELIGIGKTANEINSFANSPVGTAMGNKGREGVQKLRT